LNKYSEECVDLGMITADRTERKNSKSGQTAWVELLGKVSNLMSR